MHKVDELGGSGPALHLAPANGFPCGTYRELANLLAQHFRVISLWPRPLWPGSPPASALDWHPLAQDLIDGLDRMELSGVSGVGHSIGAVLTLWAAIQRPDLFRAIVLIDPVILPPWMLWLVAAARAVGLERRMKIARAALSRRRTFPGRQACFEHYRSKPLFERWGDEALWAYVDAGTWLRPDGLLELAFPPEWEAHIFSTLPTDVWHGLGRLRVPALVLRGELSPTFRPAAVERLRRLLPRARFVTIPGAGHLAPMERPGEVGSVILEFLDGG